MMRIAVPILLLALVCVSLHAAPSAAPSAAPAPAPTADPPTDPTATPSPAEPSLGGPTVGEPATDAALPPNIVLPPNQLVDGGVATATGGTVASTPLIGSSPPNPVSGTVALPPSRCYEIDADGSSDDDDIVILIGDDNDGDGINDDTLAIIIGGDEFDEWW